jgi:surface antigen/peptidoglycan hydrolase CwlO-like protein
LDEEQGDDKERSEPYKRYGERAPLLSTQLFAKYKSQYWTFYRAYAIIKLQMKHWSTTSVIKNKKTAKKISIVAITVLLAVTTSLPIFSPVRADDFDQKIAQIQAQIDDYQKQASALNGQADSLQKELDALTAQKNIIQQQVDLKQAEHDKLVQEIAANEKKIFDSQGALGDTITDLYLANDISPLEMLASSKSIADYVDKEAYNNSIRDSLTTTIASIKKIRQQLVDQKKDVDRVLAEQQFARDALAAKENQQATLVNQTRGQELAYQRLVGERENQKLSLQQAQQAAIEAAIRAANRGGPINILPGDPNKGGYPWEAGCWVDANAWSHGGVGGNGTDALGYGCRQCVSYTAWKVGQRTGNFPSYWGNANQWPGSARASGYDTGSTPRVNSVGVISAGAYGHVVWIEAVNGDGTVDVSQYNYYNAGGPGWGNYSKMRVNASTYDTYIYF